MFVNLKIGLIIVAIIYILIINFRVEILSTERDNAVNEANALTQRISDQNTAIMKIKKESANKEKQIKDALKQAKKIKSSYEKAAKKNLYSYVSSDCDKAIEWGAVKGPAIYKNWYNS